MIHHRLALEILDREFRPQVVQEIYSQQQYKVGLQNITRQAREFMKNKTT